MRVTLVKRDMPVQVPWLPGERPFQAGDTVEVYECEVGDVEHTD